MHLRKLIKAIVVRLLNHWANQGHGFPFIESLGIVKYIRQKRVSRSDCVDEQPDQSLHCSHMA